MKVKEETTQIHKVTIQGAEYTETEGYMADVRINVEVKLDGKDHMLDSELTGIIAGLHSAGKARVGDDGPNTYELKAKRLYKAMEHKFIAGDGKTNVVCVGVVKFIKLRVIDGELSAWYDLDARMPLAPLSQLLTYMDSECTLTTTDAQIDLFKKTA
jgi:hypothetical protein